MSEGNQDEGLSEALATLEAVQEIYLADVQRRIGPTLPEYDAMRAGTLHGWFLRRGGGGEQALWAFLDGQQPDPGPTLEVKAAQFGISPEVYASYEANVRRRLGEPSADVATLLRTAAAKRSTRYTNPWWFARLEQLARALFTARDAHFMPPHPLARELPRREQIVLGTLPGVNIRAEVMPAVRGRYRVILVDETLFIFSFLLGQLLMATKTRNGDESWSLDRDRRAKRLSDNSWIGQQVTALFRSYLLEGHLCDVRPLRFDQAREAGLAVSVTAAQLFVIGHELAHCFQPGPAEWQAPPGLENLSKKHQREHNADMIGIELAIQAGLDQGWGPEIVLGEAVLFLRAMDKLEAAVAILSGSKKDMWKGTDTHPSFRTRCYVLLGGIEHLVPPERVALTRQALMQTDALFQDMLIPMQAAVRQDAASGLSPHPIWKGKSDAKLV